MFVEFDEKDFLQTLSRFFCVISIAVSMDIYLDMISVK
jgi:hypothetical protein